MTKELNFEAVIIDAENGVDAAYIKIPVDVKDVFGSLRPKVKAVFDNKVVYRGLLVRMKTPFHMLLLRKDVRAELGKQAGDSLHVSIVLDTEERIVSIPVELEKAFAEFPETKTFFDKLSFTNRKEYANFIASAKRVETKERRVQQVVERLLKKEKKLR